MKLRTWFLLAVVAVAACSARGGMVPLPGSPAAGIRHDALPLGKNSIWSVIESPNAPPGSDGLYEDVLNGVGGDSPKDVWAVGYDCCHTHGSQEYTHSLIVRWNGSSWSVVPPAKHEPSDTYLNAVAVISRADAWAVGTAPYPNRQAVIEHWNGAKWSLVSNPYVANGAILYSVVAISPKNVWAAGVGNFSALLEHWNGAEWSFVPGLTMGGLTVLNSIAATGPNDIMAAGSFSAPNLNLFAEHWNGTSWAYAAPSNSFFQSDFTGLTAVSKNDYWAVGWQEPNEANQVPQTLAERWTATAPEFVVAPTPNKDPKTGYLLYNELTGVATVSPNEVWAVGSWTYYPGSGTSRSLFERWNGAQWQVEPGPAALESGNNATDNELLGIARIRGRILWAVGNQSTPGSCCDETLTVQTTHR
jgi:hypothetical protein